MQIIEASQNDIPAIVELLKVSLGESLMPKSESYWRWKHEENPFGRSPVLLAKDEGRVVGVRAFMRWSWQWREKRLEAVRAVDTATDPAYQGKGIFRQLTMAMLEQCGESGIQLVYNTPNDKSLPGYLKMGWEKAGQLPVCVKLLQPLSMVVNMITNKNLEIANHDDGELRKFLMHPGLPKLLQMNQTALTDSLITPHSVDSLRWRYLSVPVAKYGASGIEDGSNLRSLFIYRVKSSRMGREFRVTDIFNEGNKTISDLKQLIIKTAYSHGAHYITTSGFNPVLKGGFSLSRPIGPVVTVRNIAMSNLVEFQNFSRWKPSMGDLELF
jgi:GNAT superfamily N-acetyltransferase